MADMTDSVRLLEPSELGTTRFDELRSNLLVDKQGHGSHRRSFVAGLIKFLHGNIDGSSDGSRVWEEPDKSAVHTAAVFSIASQYHLYQCQNEAAKNIQIEAAPCLKALFKRQRLRQSLLATWAPISKG